MKALKLFLVLFAVVVTKLLFLSFRACGFTDGQFQNDFGCYRSCTARNQSYEKGNASVDRDFLNLSLWAFAISLVAFVSVTYNHTQDNTFSTYFMSMWVWLGGAYALVYLLKTIYGQVSVPLVINYLIVVCVVQCVLALVFDSNASAEDWHARTFAGEGYMGNTDEDRLHGIGCSLDVAGFRFAAVICMAAFLSFVVILISVLDGFRLFILLLFVLLRLWAT